MNLYFQVWKKYAVFSGRATRSEFWLFEIINFLLLLVFGAVSALTSETSGVAEGEEFANPAAIIYLVFVVAAVLPRLGVGVRRLHDTGKPGIWILISAVPMVGQLALLVLMLQGSEKEDNEYGPGSQIDSGVFE